MLLPSEHDGERLPEIGVVERLPRTGSGADHREARLGDPREPPSEVRDRHERNPLGGAARRLAGDRGEGCAAPSRDDDRVGSRPRRATHARAQVAGVLDLVEHDDHGGGRGPAENLLERHHRRLCAASIARNDTLVGARTGHAPDRLAARAVHGDVRRGGEGQRAAQCRGLAPRLHPHFQHPRGVALDQRADRVHSEDQLRPRHIEPRRPPKPSRISERDFPREGTRLRRA